MKRRILAAVTAGVVAFSLSACGTSNPGKDTTSSAAKETSDSPTVTVTDKGMPTIKESVDSEQPIIVFKEGSQPPKGITVSVLEEGKGRAIERTDMVSADYVGAVWGKTEAFDSSFKRDTPLTMSLTQLVPGWGYGLEGHKVGTKLLLSIPPEYGYGESGQADAGIGGTDTIVFYIHVLDAYSMQEAGQSDATMETSLEELPVTFDGKLGEPIRKISVKDGSVEPSAQDVRVIARGSGDPVPNGNALVYFQIAQTMWDNSASVTTWGEKPEAAAGLQEVSMGDGSALDSLAGIPVGSRVYVALPANEQSGAMAAVVDIIAVQSMG